MGFRKVVSELAKSALERVCECDYNRFVEYRVDELFKFKMNRYTIIAARVNFECLILNVLDLNGENVRLEASELLALNSICKQRIIAKYN